MMKMFRTALLVAAALMFVHSPSYAGKLERAVESRWLGAWVLTKGSTHSNCSGAYTDNRTHGSLVSGQGRQRFHPGELARVQKVNVKRRRVDLRLSVVEPVLIPYQDGPFTLYSLANCHFELEVTVARNMVKKKDVNGIDSMILQQLERFSNESEVQRSRLWNKRVRDDYPGDYEQTLAEHAAWKAEQHNMTVQAKLDRALDVTTNIANEMGNDYYYLKGFAAGVEAARSTSFRNCSNMLALNLRGSKTTGVKTASNEDVNETKRKRGYRDGQRLVYGLKLLRQLPGCFMEVPEH